MIVWDDKQLGFLPIFWKLLMIAEFRGPKHCCWCFIGIMVLTFAGCGPAGERAKDKAPDPGVNAESAAQIPTGDVNKNNKAK